MNRRDVLDELTDRAGRPVTLAELATATNLAVNTVSSIVRELQGAGVVETVPGSGRRGGTVVLARDAGVVLAIDFGHTHLSVAIANLRGEILCERKIGLVSDDDHIAALHSAKSLADDLFSEHSIPQERLQTVAMGLPAPVSRGIVMGAGVMPGWVGQNAAELVAAAFGVGAIVDNDANLGALAEARYGAGRGHSDLVYVKVSSGVGAGVIIDGKIFHGSGGLAGELGHLTVDEQGPLCRCGGRGCLEAYAASRGVLDMLSGHFPAATLTEVIDAARGGNVAALRAFEDAGNHLGRGMAAVANILDPGVVIVGGDMAQAGDLLLESARVGVRRHMLAGGATTPVVVGELGDRAPLLGAMAIAIESTQLLLEVSN